MDLVVDIPQDHLKDVAAIAFTGPCEQVQRGQYRLTGAGVCRITVSFLSGAPDYVTDVKITSNPGPCCAGQLIADPSFVDVPESAPTDAATDG
jgi:hypothetical protein